MKIRASHILVETKEQAENLLLDIKNGVAFEDLDTSSPTSILKILF